MWQLLNNLPYPRDSIGKEQQVKINGVAEATGGISIFRDGFEPCWESCGETGGTFEWKLYTNAKNVGTVQAMWQTLVIDMLGTGEPLKHGVDTNMVVGARVLDKTCHHANRGSPVVAKYEVWVTHMDTRPEVAAWLADLFDHCGTPVAKTINAKQVSFATVADFAFVQHSEKLKADKPR